MQRDRQVIPSPSGPLTIYHDPIGPNGPGWYWHPGADEPTRDPDGPLGSFAQAEREALLWAGARIVGPPGGYPGFLDPARA